MKSRRNLLSALATSALALTGCQSTENTVRFGKYTMSRQTYNQIVRDVSEFEREPIDFEEFLHFGKNYDKNQDGVISAEEGRAGVEGLVTSAK